MKRRKYVSAISAMLALVLLAAMLGGCGVRTAAPEQAEPVVDNEPAAPAEPTEPAEPAAPAEPAETAGPEAVRQPGERFETVIVLEGMEETVNYEHVRNDAIGYEMDFDYEEFVRLGGPDSDRFVSAWDDGTQPENYLEITYNPHDAAAVADAIGALFSVDYEISRDDAFPLGREGSCIRIDASADKGGLTMPDRLLMAYIIPADDGCRVATAHYVCEAAEGFGRRFHYFMDSFSAVPAQGDQRLSDEQAVAAIRNYCLINNPDLAGIVKSGEYPAYWDVESSGEDEIVVVFRSYTGALNRFHIDPVSGEAYVTELVPGIIDEEQRTDETLNVWDYSF